MKIIDHLNEDILDPNITPKEEALSELKDAGADIEKILAKGQHWADRFANELQKRKSRRSAMRYPSWIIDGQVTHAAAAYAGNAGETLKIEHFDVNLTLRPIFDGNGSPGMIEFSWQVSGFNPTGWGLSIERKDGNFIEFDLGNEVRGTRLLTAKELGFDPIIEPIRYAFFAR